MPSLSHDNSSPSNTAENTCAEWTGGTKPSNHYNPPKKVVTKMRISMYVFPLELEKQRGVTTIGPVQPPVTGVKIFFFFFWGGGGGGGGGGCH